MTLKHLGDLLKANMTAIPSARFVIELTERDPITNEEISLSVYQDDKTDRYFAIDSSYMIDEAPHIVRCPFGHAVELLDEDEE